MLFSGTIDDLRKLISILLLIVFSLPLASPLLAQGSDVEVRVAACCRKGGKHQCMMGTEARNGVQSTSARVTAPREKCPYCPDSPLLSHDNPLAMSKSVGLLVSSATGPAGIAQTESKWRISRDRSRQKRGPPVKHS